MPARVVMNHWTSTCGRCELHNGDALATLRGMPDGLARCCVTSPPYWGLRDYGVDGQLGLEATPEAYIASMVEVFREVRRVLADDGTLWLNIGDSYSRAPEKGGSGTPNGRNTESMGYGAAQISKLGSSDGLVGRADRPGSRASSPDLKPKDLVGIPWMLAFALRADGWYLRQDIIWHKPNPMPESVRDRCTKAHEYLFLLSKRERYYFDEAAMSEPAATGYNGSEFHTGKTGEHQLGRSSKQPRFGGSKYGDSDDPKHATKSGNEYEPNGTRNRRSVWTVATAPSRWSYCRICERYYEKGNYKLPSNDSGKKVCICGASDGWVGHFASYPPSLIEPCILAGSAPGDTVLDPFVGSGTSAIASAKHDRRSVGIELNHDYYNIAAKRIESDQ